MTHTNTSPQFTIEEVTDPTEIARARDQTRRARQNSEWLESHWSDLLPQARGRFLAVAGRHAHIADNAEAAWAWVESAHPDDDGAFVQYVRAEKGPRIYAHRG